MKLVPINKVEAINFVQKYHYSKVMPRINKHYLGLYDKRILGVVTLGWGTQPLNTIKKLFPDEQYTTKDYFEIGKMCLHPDMNSNRNTGSMLISLLTKWMKENTDCKYLYTLADGIVGKLGYVYQASNFLYGGYFWTDVYIGSDGEKIHPRSAKVLLKENANFLNKDRVFWLTPDFCKLKGIQRIRGKMFRYMLPLNKRYRKVLINSGWNIDYPKKDDLKWKIQESKGVYRPLDNMPVFALDVVNINKKNVNMHKTGLQKTETSLKCFI